MWGPPNLCQPNPTYLTRWTTLYKFYCNLINLPVVVCLPFGSPAHLDDGARRILLPALDVDDAARAALAAVLLLPLPVQAGADDGGAFKDAM